MISSLSYVGSVNAGCYFNATITFDDIQTITGDFTLNRFETKGIGISGFSLLDPVTGTQPQSAPNVITHGAGNTVTAGTPTLAVKFNDSGLASFSLGSFYAGCGLVSAVETQCAITVEAFDEDEASKGTEKFNFQPQAAVTGSMALFVPKTATFGDLSMIQFTTDNGALTATAGWIRRLQNGQCTLILPFIISHYPYMPATLIVRMSAKPE